MRSDESFQSCEVTNRHPEFKVAVRSDVLEIFILKHVAGNVVLNSIKIKLTHFITERLCS